MLFVETVMASKTDLRSYFKKVDSEMLTSSHKTPRLIQSASNITDEAEVQYSKDPNRRPPRLLISGKFSPKWTQNLT